GVAPVLEQLDQIAAVAARHHVESREVQVLLDLGGDTRLMRTEERVRALRVRFGPRGAESEPDAAAGQRESGSPARGQAQQASPAEARAGLIVVMRHACAPRQDRVVAVNRDSGSARALMRSM